MAHHWRRVNQALPNDDWTLGCQPESPDNPNCPAKMGPESTSRADTNAVDRAPRYRELLRSRL